MRIDPGLLDWLNEALAPFGPVTARAMMGGSTLYCDGTLFAIADGDALWFKADGESDPVWDAAGCERTSFTGKDGRTVSMNYRQAPSDVYDDTDALQHWAALAIEASRRAAVRRPRGRAARAASSD
ncbi:competence protein TfoX [Sphingomonas oleivorans]|uniref:Competence protein TfoX n=1 Tax=Sphingomonas oleivorans TaxID=1735121 RepID=A0A2T5G2X8_9SPHN|nr:TfoX/Sxy family protein [Sphingomonas oleivorans]PTQ13495.1 competence protein TfoX [Sphingomonas oleivorans]